MTHISKQQLDTRDLEQLFTQLSAVSSLLTKRSAGSFYEDLLGPEEKIMLSKRLAAIVMFIEGNSSYRVWQLLKMSPSTAERIKLNYETGKYKHIENILISNRREYEQFWVVLERILQAGMPPRGRGRWRSVFKN